MKIAPILTNEQERLKAVSEYFIPDTLPEPGLDAITAIAAKICGTPVSFISIIDANNQWITSSYGLALPKAAKNSSFCIHTISDTSDVLIVPDLTADPRFRDNPLVTGEPHAVFYAGASLISPKGYKLGTLCVVDSKTRELDGEQIKTLQALARQVVSLLELKKKTILLQQTETELTHAYADLEEIVRIASHDLKSPLNNIISLTHLLKDDHSEQLGEEGNEYITYLNDAAYRLSDLVSGIVIYNKAIQSSVTHKEQVNVAELIEEVTGQLNLPANATVSFKKYDSTPDMARVPVKQILLQLLQNAVQHNHSSKIELEVLFHENTHAYTFEVKDNGPGIAENDKEKIFTLFKRLNDDVKDGESMGIGLSIVKRLVEKAGGEIKVASKIDKGSSFVFTIPK